MVRDLWHGITSGFAGDDSGALATTGREDFDGDVSVQLGVCGAPHLTHTTLAEFGGDPIMGDGLLGGHLFNPVSQFSTTVTGDDGSPVATFTIRNFLPSDVTSYRNCTL